MVSKNLLRELDEQLTEAIRLLQEGASFPLIGLLSNMANITKYPEKDNDSRTVLFHSKSGRHSGSRDNGVGPTGSNGRSSSSDKNVKKEEGLEKKISIDNIGYHGLYIKESDQGDDIIYGVLLVPDEDDLDGDNFPAEVIARACTKYSDKLKADEQHKYANPELEVVDSFISPEGYNIDGNPVKTGSWVVGIKTDDQEVVRKVKSGEYKGLSVEGNAVVRSRNDG